MIKIINMITAMSQTLGHAKKQPNPKIPAMIPITKNRIPGKIPNGGEPGEIRERERPPSISLIAT
jgi:hypothetical protein